MRFIVRKGTDPIAGADRTMLAAMGMPAGGAIKIGRTVVLVRPAKTTEPSAVLLGSVALTNAETKAGQSVEASRAILANAEQVILLGESLPIPARRLVKALQGRPVSNGDKVIVDARFTDDAEPIELIVESVGPAESGLVGPGTSFRPADGPVDVPASPTEAADLSVSDPSTMALLTGLENELDVLSGWFSLLTSPTDLPSTWGLPAVAGIILEAPYGVGKLELVSAAAANAGAIVHEVDLDLVFKPQRLLDLLERAVKDTPAPGVVFVDRLEAVMGEEGLVAFKSQVGAIIRWFIDAIADKPGLVCVLGVESTRHLGRSLTGSPLLPRTLRIPPPDLQRRESLFEIGLERVPTGQIDFAGLAARSAGFSGSDIMAAIVQASAMVARSGDEVSQKLLIGAIAQTSPSLGSASIGEMPSYGFDKVANLSEVKQRLTEAVIWPMTRPERFEKMGIEPPKGILLYGPPGTGKTFVIRALANESGAAFFPVKGAELLDKYVGESERGVREVFERARTTAPSMVFFDELDALAPVRGSSATSVTDSVVAALLTEIDGVGSRGDVVVIGATNRRDLIDPALLRAGRFEVHVKLGLPGKEGRRALLGITDVPFADEVELDELAARTEGFSFADLTGILREAAIDVLRSDSDRLAVGWLQLDAAIAQFRTQRIG